MLDALLLTKMSKAEDEKEEMDVEETFGSGIATPRSPFPETEVGVGGLEETEDEGTLPLPDEEKTAGEGEEEW
ncbi:MAG: hypothetical protein AAB631_02125 [Patescibacteria group bacterium]